jgi:hypothetical protein
MKKTFLVALLSVSLAIPAATQSATDFLQGLQPDFDALLTGIAQDVAPTMTMSSLGGDLIGDATISHFTIYLPGIGANLSPGIGTVLQPGAHDWQFVLPMDSLVGALLGGNADVQPWVDMLTSELMAYPAIKIGLGIGFGSGWDAILSGIYFDQTWTDAIIGAIGEPTITALKPLFSLYNVGLRLRKSFLEDSGVVPALSLGLGYTLSGNTIGIRNISLPSPMDIGFGTLSLSGKLSYVTQVHNIGFDIHLSKHLLFITPFLKLSGVYSYGTVKGDTEFIATITPPVIAGLPAGTINPISQPLTSKPTIVVSDFSALATMGLEIYLAFFVLDANVVVDLARASFAAADNPIGLTGKAVSANVWFRLDF